MNDRRRAEIMHGAGVAKKRIGAMLQMKHIPIQIDTEFLDRNIRRAAAFNPDAPLANNEEIRKRLMLSPDSSKRQTRWSGKHNSRPCEKGGCWFRGYGAGWIYFITTKLLTH